jgi:glyoxylase-like metal-dependent hydrolase (beta-lactamase superfamily II)
VLVTHGHIDHAGLAYRWAMAGAIVLAGAADIPALLGGREWNEERIPLRLEALRRHGAPEEVLLVYEAEQARRGLAWEPCPAERVAPVADGTRIPLGEGDGKAAAQLRVVAAPGHTPGNLVALLEEEGEPGDLYSGDTLLPDTVPTPGLHFPVGPDGTVGPRWPSLPPFLDSITRVHALGPHRTLSAHGTPGANSHRLIARFEAHHARRGARYRALIEAQPDTAYGIVARAFRFIGPLQQAAAMIEVIGHLDVLLGSGRAERDAFDGVWRYRLVSN